MSEIKLKSLPDLGGLFAQMKVREGLEDLPHEKSILGTAIGLALHKKAPLGEILGTIIDQYYDCPEGVTNIVGEDLMYRILKLLKKKP